ncbi:MAG TPA: hypothetical protein VG713_00275, partial [Pirellulales bacterium]|nr:hypothetical protein [Pirellulales bacterium]
SIVTAAAFGTTLGFWRERTFQSLALAVVALLAWSGLWEVLASLGASHAVLRFDDLSLALSPWHALRHAARPIVDRAHDFWAATSIAAFCAANVLMSAVIMGIGAWRLRAWNTGSEPHRMHDELAGSDATPKPLAAHPHQARKMWDNPILWREMRTWAYGRRTWLLRVLYLVPLALTIVAVVRMNAATVPTAPIDLAVPLVPLMILSLLLVNAQAVTGMTSERDTYALDLLLVTDLTSREIVFGKLAGALWNAKEMVLLPAALIVYLRGSATIGVEPFVLVLAGWGLLCIFAAVLGFHCGLSYTRSRLAIGVSLGTMLFLGLGIATTMRILTAFSGSFAFQLQPFLAMIVGGGAGLYAALGARNPSTATFAAAFFCPVATFYGLTSFLLGHTLAVFLAIVAAYGFNVAAMLMPAVYEFDALTGRAEESD